MAEGVERPEETDPVEGERSFGHRVVKGGVYLTLREALGVLIRLGGVTVVTRLLGPVRYGEYYGALAFVLMVSALAQLGSDTWVIRLEKEPDDIVLAQIWNTLLLTSLLATGIALLLSIPASLVIAPEEVTLFRWLVLTVPINVLWAPAQGRLERRLDFRSMARLEIVGDLVLYGVAVPLALEGAGAYALLIGFAAWQTYLLVASMLMARVRPRLTWSRATSSQLVSFGLGFCAADWARRLAGLAAPVLIGAVAGYSGLGYYGLASRLVDTTSFGQRSAGRLGAATFSRIADKERLRRTLEQGMFVQTLITGLPMLVVALLSRQLIPLVFGRQWTPSIDIFCVSAIGVLLYSQISLQFYLLYVKDHISTIAKVTIIRTALLWPICIPFTFWFGVLGFCGASIVASVLSWYFVDRAVRRITPFSYRSTAPWTIGLAAAVMIPTMQAPERWLLLLPLVLAGLDPRARNGAVPAVRHVVGLLRESPPFVSGGTERSSEHAPVSPPGSDSKFASSGMHGYESSRDRPHPDSPDTSAFPPPREHPQMAEQGSRGDAPLIVLVVRDYFPATGGTSTQTRLHARELLRRGYNVTVLTQRLAGATTKEYLDGVLVCRVGPEGHSRRSKVALLASNYLWLVRRRKQISAVSVIMDPDLAICAVAAGLASRSAMTWATSGDPSHGLSGPLGRLRRRLLVHVRQVVLTPQMCEELDRLGLSGSAIIPVPVDLEHLGPADPAERQRRREELGILPSSQVVLFVGHIQRRKAIDRLVEAVVEMLRNGGDVSLLVVGGTVETEDHLYENELRHRVEVASLTHRVRFFGPRTDIPRFLAAADVLCLPSQREGMPNVLLEAMASGVPCVAPESAGGGVLLSGGAGVVADDNTPTSLRAALELVLGDHNSAAAMAQCARSRVTLHHAPSAVIEQYLRLLGAERSEPSSATA